MKRQRLRYNPKLTEKARALRNESTLAEVLLWNQLKRKQMRGYDFHRQKPIDRYIVDFFCQKLMLAIEIDGTSHMFRGERDAKRQERLESLGVHFLRVDDLDVKFRMDDVLKMIEQWIDGHTKK
ncbi:MAG: DUF559 domain-containing protein [Bacteroidetes bacterium]|nr:DUF559 domain-containing protein [Bacteroidota bacterium]MCW5897452.1 DUF559 domain-containing protein [Bacteroidota bacterium]